MATNSSRDAVELWTSAFYHEGEGTSKAKSEAQYYFESQIFYLATSKTIPEYLHSRLKAAQEAEVPFIVIASIRGDPKWLSSVLSGTFPMLASGPMQNMPDVKRWERGTVVLPVVDKETRCMSFFMQYPMVEKAKPTIKFCPVATWLCASSSAAFPTVPTTSSPVVFMACCDNEIPKRLQEQCVSGNWKVQQLSSAPGRIFIDLFSFLAEWSDVWSLARHELARRDAELHGETRSLGVLQQTRVLHRDTANFIAVREDLRLHITAFQKYRSLTKSFATKRSPLRIADGDEQEDLEDRIEECLQNLLHQQESSAVIHRQLENLLSLAFNTEMVSQGQAVARLNTLAFAFLPLSYVAALFGMTNFSISAKWYPVGAVIVLFFVLLGFTLSEHFPRWHVKRLAKGSTKQPAMPAVGEAKPNDAEATKPLNDNHSSISNTPASNAITAQPPPPTSNPATNRELNFLQRLNPYSRRKTVYELQSVPAPAGPYHQIIHEAPDQTPTQGPGIISYGSYGSYGQCDQYKIRRPIEPSFLSSPVCARPAPYYSLEGATQQQQPSPLVPYTLPVLPTVYSMEGEASSAMPLLQVPSPSASRSSTPESQGGARRTPRGDSVVSCPTSGSLRFRQPDWPLN